MPTKWAGCTAGALLLFQAGAAGAAACHDLGSPQARAWPPLSALSDAQTEVLVSAPLMLKLMKVDEAAVRRTGSRCGRTTFEVAGVGGYQLTGEDADRTFPRRALPTGGGPVVFISPVASLAEMMKSSRSAASPPATAYVLASARGRLVEGFRLYDSVPDDDRLIADMTEVLRGETPPLFRITPDGKHVLLVGGAD